MSYERKVWDCGDAISTSALNNIEDGVEEALARSVDFGIRGIDASSAEVLFGDFDAIYQKVRNHEIIVGHYIDCIPYGDAEQELVFQLSFVSAHTELGIRQMVMHFIRTPYVSATSASVEDVHIIWTENSNTTTRSIYIATLS